MGLVFFLLFLLVVLGNIFFFVHRLKFPVHVSPFILILGYTLILYIFSLMKILLVGYYLVVAFASILAIYGYWCLAKDKSHWKESINLPLILFVIAVLGSFLYTRYTMFYHWDDFSHWGVIFKYLMLKNSVPTEVGSVIINYPPFLALSQYMIAKVLGFEESNAFFAQMLVAFSAILAALPQSYKKKWFFYILAFFISGITIHAFDYSLHTLLEDGIMGILFGAGLALVPLNKKINTKKLIPISLTIVALMLSKPTGKILSAIIILIVMCRIIPLKEKFHLRDFFTTHKRFVFQIMSLIIVALFASLSWRFYSANFIRSTTHITLKGETVGIEEMFPLYLNEYRIELQSLEQKTRKLENESNNILDQTIAIEDIIKSFTIAAPYHTKSISQTMSQNLTIPIFYTVHLSVPLTLTIFAVLLIGVGIYIHQHHSQQLLALILQNIVLLLGLISYILMLYMVYIFIMMPDESFYAPSFGRYLGTYLLGWWMFVFSRITTVIFTVEDLKWKTTTQVFFVSLFLLIFNAIPLNSYIHLPRDPEPERFLVQRVYKMINPSQFTGTDKIYHVWQPGETSVGYEHYVMRYYLTPISSNINGWMLGSRYSETDKYTQDFSPEEWLALLNDQGYTHVLVSIADDNFWNTYGDLFDHYIAYPDAVEFNTIPQLFAVHPDGLYNLYVTEDND